MKSPLLFALILTAGQIGSALAGGAFFAAPGKYLLSPEITLTISREAERHPQFMLTYSSGGGSGKVMTGAEPNDPFLVFWDGGKQTLWWATPSMIGYFDVSTRGSTRSSSRERRIPLATSDNFRPGPPEFLAELERRLPAQP